MTQPLPTSRIRPATAPDYNEITDVWEASVRATHHFLSEEDIQHLKPLVRHQFLAAVQLFCLLDDHNNIIGFCGVVEDKLEMLFVHPAYHGKGVGKALLQYAIQQLGISKVDVNEGNEKAVLFYQRFGFEVKGRSSTDALGKPFPILHLSLSEPSKP